MITAQESAGLATSQRQSLDNHLAVITSRSVERFLREVRLDAITPADALALTAAASPGRQRFSASSVLARWLSESEIIARQLARVLGVRTGSEPGPLVGAYLRGAALRLARHALPTEVYETASAALSLGIEQGWSHYRLTREMRAVLAPTSSHSAITQSMADGALPATLAPVPGAHAFAVQASRIARTEATAAYNVGVLDDLTRNPRPLSHHKMWVSHHDALVRPSHLAANGQKVPVPDSFVVGSSHLLYPGDPSAPAHETANCRCVMVSRR